MRLRLAAIAFLVASLCTGVTWLTLQPVLIRLVNALARLAPEDSPELRLLAQLRTSLPLMLAFDLLVIGVICYGILHLTVGRGLQAAQSAVEQLSRLELDLPLRPSGGPLLSRFQHALSRTAQALQKERDLTQSQLKKLETANDSLSRAQTELVAAERLAMVGQLAAGVAHEIGNPLAGILGYLSLARARAKSSPDLVDCIDRTESEVQRIDQIVRGLLDLGRPSKGTLGPVELAPLVDASTRLVRAGPDFAQVKLTVDLEPGLVANAEAGPLSQVLLNLLLNAAQAQNGKGQVTVRGRAAGSELTLEVEDSGAGLSAQVQENLFRPFFTTKSAGKGTGLGLAVCLHLVRSMGGQLVAANAPEGGARFTVRLARL